MIFCVSKIEPEDVKNPWMNYVLNVFDVLANYAESCYHSESSVEPVDTLINNDLIV